MAKKGEVKFDENLKEQFLELLAATGLKHRSARACGIHPTTMLLHINNDPDFAEAVETALADYRERVEAEIHRRAIEGIDSPVFFQGVLVAHKKEYSDRLLELHAKRHIPAYREKQSIDHNVKGGVLVVPGLADSSKKWEDEEHGGSSTDAEDG